MLFNNSINVTFISCFNQFLLSYVFSFLFPQNILLNFFFEHILLTTFHFVSEFRTVFCYFSNAANAGYGE